MHKLGTVILAEVQFTDLPETKVRPAVVLFEEHGNVVVAGITSNLRMEGISLTKAEGAVQDSIIKLNYIFTISSTLVHKVLFSLSHEKKKLMVDTLLKKLSP
ncbi:type II toxin-antitoxin system PemK/MazF family toxin [Candidatus Woesearchaeota archaeon]|nr:type II toxin-antitoxin system PemK/MazF family toxin [Candidatus Woesearchaeota archaeon]